MPKKEVQYKLPWQSELKFTQSELPHFVEPNSPLTGKAIAILGGGPSLDKTTIEALRHRPVICVNNSYQLVSRATVIVALDRRWYSWHKAHIINKDHDIVSAIRPNSEPNMPPKSVHHMEKQREIEMPTSRRALSGNNSGHAAVCLAYLLGASRIYVAGFDMGFDGQKTHWHGGHSVPPSEANYTTRFRPRFEKFVNMLSKAGVQVSAITPTMADIPSTPLQTALEDLDATHGMDNIEARAALS